MKIIEITNKHPIILTNQEHNFIKEYGDVISISSLADSDRELVRKLVIKGVYIPGKIPNTVCLTVRNTD